jgi:LacI family transcriptional regulator
MATQKDVAERAGVSFISVSRVVNGLGNVAPGTRERVEAAIKELNYHPNRQAQALNNGLTHTIAFVTPRMYDLVLYNNFFVMSLLSGVELQARELGWDILITTDYDRSGVFDFLRVWHQRKVDGIIFVAFQRFPESQKREIEGHGIPFVAVADRVDSPAVSWIDTDSATAARDAVRRLLELGHRSFAFIGIDPAEDYNPNILERERAVAEALGREGLGLTVLKSSSSSPSTGLVAARAYLRLAQRPTAVISGNDSIAFHFIEEAARQGLTCPEDYSIVGFDSEPSGRVRTPSLASYEQPLLDMGKSAASILIREITEERGEKETEIFPLRFAQGQSCGPAPLGFGQRPPVGLAAAGYSR